MDDMFEFFSEKMNEFYTALYLLDKPIIYGIVSYAGTMNLIIGVYDSDNDAKMLKSIIEGLLDGIELRSYEMDLASTSYEGKEVGLISAIPSVEINDKKQKFSLVPMMRSLNGHDYSVLFISRPLRPEKIARKRGELIQIKDKCFAISKRNISQQVGSSHSIGSTEGHSESRTQSTSKTQSNLISQLLSNCTNFKRCWI